MGDWLAAGGVFDDTEGEGTNRGPVAVDRIASLCLPGTVVDMEVATPGLVLVDLRRKTFRGCDFGGEGAGINLYKIARE